MPAVIEGYIDRSIYLLLKIRGVLSPGIPKDAYQGK
jgi:hypothetical protein